LRRSLRDSNRPLGIGLVLWINVYAVNDWFVPCFDAYRKGDYKTSLVFARKVNMPGFWRTQLAIAANAGQLGELATAKQSLHTLLLQRPEIAKTPRQELAIWWQPDIVEGLMVGLHKADLEPDGRILTVAGGSQAEI
jgi:hypothetical protein